MWEILAELLRTMFTGIIATLLLIIAIWNLDIIFFGVAISFIGILVRFLLGF